MIVGERGGTRLSMFTCSGPDTDSMSSEPLKTLCCANGHSLFMVLNSGLPLPKVEERIPSKNYSGASEDELDVSNLIEMVEKYRMCVCVCVCVWCVCVCVCV